MRQSWDEYFMSIAEVVATRSTCDRRHVGAVIVRNKTILSTGYNGSLPGTLHCDDIGHDMVDGHCIRTTHAEVNAITQAAKNGIRISGASIYVTSAPCFQCFKAIISSDIIVLFYTTPYLDKKVTEYMKQLPFEFAMFQL